MYVHVFILWQRRAKIREDQAIEHNTHLWNGGRRDVLERESSYIIIMSVRMLHVHSHIHLYMAHVRTCVCVDTYIASKRGHGDVIQMLKKAKADINHAMYVCMYEMSTVINWPLHGYGCVVCTLLEWRQEECIGKRVIVHNDIMLVHMLHVHSRIHLYVVHVHVHVCVDIQSRNRGIVILMQFSTHCRSSGGDNKYSD